LNYSGVFNNTGGNPGSNRELAMPQIAALPIELQPPYNDPTIERSDGGGLYLEVIRTPTIEYQKFRIYLLIYEILYK
jgi:hypothetical protein